MTDKGARVVHEQYGELNECLFTE